MALTAGIVGLPNVGKSTLFNAITNAQVEAANYPFATIDPNVGVVEVPDYRLDKLTEIFKPKKTIPTTFGFTDIAGLVKGASRGEGLGNKFLGNIRETDAICEVVRCFRDKDVTHVDGDVDPIRDIETINLELIFADLETVERRIGRLGKKAQSGDKYEMERMIRDNNGLIWSIVKRFNGRGYDLEDLYQIGCMGFIKSIKRFDTNYDVKLSTYAVPYMIGEIKRYIRDDGPIKVSRSIKELGMKIRELQKENINKKGKELTIEELEKELKISKEDIGLALEANNTVESIDGKFYTDNKDGNSINLLEKISSDKNEEECITNKLAIKQLIEGLEDRDKEIIFLRFYKDKTQSQVAKILGITQVQVSRLERKILENMKMKLIS